MTIKETTSNIFSDVALFQLMMNQKQVIFETDSKALIEHLLEVFKSNKIYKKTTFTINTKYINHSIIEDGYFTFSQIYQHHNVIKYTIVNTPFTKNIAEIVSEWFEFMIGFEKETDHWKVHHLMFSNQPWNNIADGFTNAYPNLNLLDGTRDFTKGTWVSLSNYKDDGTLNGLNVKTLVGTTNLGLYKDYTIPISGVYTTSLYVKTNGLNAEFDTQVVGGATVRIDTNSQVFVRKSYTAFYTAGKIVRFYVRLKNNADVTDGALSVAGYKIEPGSTATPYMSSATEVTTADYPSYIGHYTDFTSDDSTEPSNYIWGLIKGDKGTKGIQELQGATGTQGIAGPRGADGKRQFTHLAYANSADGMSSFNTSDSNRTYIGMYVDFNTNDSTTPSDYAWTPIKGVDGTQGIPGKTGADGKTPYFHTAWANSVSGLDMYEPEYTGNRPLYIGSYSDNLLIKSKDVTDYYWEKTPEGELPKESSDKFNFSTQLTKELVSVKGQSPINKRHFRNDSWHYETNENYPEMGGYES